MTNLCALLLQQTELANSCVKSRLCVENPSILHPEEHQGNQFRDYRRIVAILNAKLPP